MFRGIHALGILAGLAAMSLQAAPRVTLNADGPTIPGIGIGLRVFIQNDDDDPVRIPPFILARVTSGNDVFFARTDATEHVHLVLQWPSPYEEGDRLLVPPHSTGSFELPAHLNDFFYDRRLSRAGVYKLELVLSDIPVPDEDVAARLYYGNVGHALVSNSAIVSVVTPTGSDAVVWSYMKQLAKSDAWGAVEWIRFGPQLKEFILGRFPNTQYGAVMLLRDSSARSAGRFGSIGESLKNSGRFGDWIRLAEATYHEDQARAELRKHANRDLRRAAEESDAAVQQYEQLSRSSASELVKLIVLDSGESRVTPEFVRSFARNSSR